MKNIYKLISLLLAVMMILSAITTLFTVNAFAEDATDVETGSGEEYEPDTSEPSDSAPSVAVDDYLNYYFATPEEKIASMQLAYKKDGVCLYVDSISGEVAYVNENTGEKLFSNPYDIASTTGNDATKHEILSQIIVEYKKTTAGINDPTEKLNSYVDAAERGQITVENIKGGVRVEYAIGREQSKMLVPRLITMERFEEMILAPLLEIFGSELYNPRSQNSEVFDVQKMLSYYMVYSVDALDRKVYSNQDIINMNNTFGGLYENLRDSDAQYARALKQFPIIETTDVYVFDPKAGDKELARAEEIITKYCPEYTYEELAYDHILTDYQSDDSNPPLFRMALEYKITEDGLSVTLPANGIRFNEAVYTLESIQILPYMGAGNTAYDGYNFFPDGSGALFDFKGYSEQISVEGKVYGDDHTRSEITGKYQNAIRYPVFGIVEETVYYTYQRYDNDGKLIEENKIAGNIVDAIKANSKGESTIFCNGQAEKLADKYLSIIKAESTAESKTIEKRGFICIVEEGDALASITTLNEPDARADYSTIKVAVTPRPKDKFKLEGADGEIPVVSDRKYVGNYTMKYITLSDAENASKEASVYDASWFGMAVAYRDYLTNNGIISKLSSDEITADNIPLYIETFGTIETIEKILSIPVTVMAPLTTFDNVETIYTELSAQGMKNINFKLTGYANGGMWSTIPGNLKFEQAVGGNKGFQELLDKANEENKKDGNNFGIFPDFNFAYVKDTNIFSGYSAYKHNAKTIDDRYASRREWSATQQKYVNYFEMVVSPAYFVEFYEKLKKNYADKYDGEIGISVSTLGTALNSDFDEDEPYNREDSKQHTVEAFQHFDATYSQVMTEGANAYTWKYVDHMLGVALDSSRYNFASRSVPFVGVVLHGSMLFAGKPLNMEGDLQYAMLKAIENGASPYFVLSFQNTQVLKEDKQLSKYYSIRYDIWGDDIKNTYSVLNDVLADVQDKYIVGHDFLMNGVRIPDSDELIEDILLQYEILLHSYQNAAELLEKELQMAASIARENGRLAELYAAEAAVKVMELYKNQINNSQKIAIFDSEFYDNLKNAYAEYCKVAYANPVSQEQLERVDAIYKIIEKYNITYAECKDLYDEAYNAYNGYLEGEEYKSYKTLVDAVYDDCASGKISASQIDYAIGIEVAQNKLDEAIKSFKSGKITKDQLLSVINTYGAAYINTTDYDTAVNNYLSGNLAHEAVRKAAEAWGKNKKSDAHKEAFLAAIAGYADGTLADIALTDAVEAWYDSIADEDYKAEDYSAAELDKAIDTYKNGKLTASKLTSFIGMYFFAKLDKDAILAATESIKGAKAAYDKAKSNYTLEAISDDEFEELKAIYEKAEADYDKLIESFKKNQNYSANFKRDLNDYNNYKIIYERGIERQSIDKTDAKEIYEAQLAIYTPICNTFIFAASEGLDFDAVTSDINEYKEKADLYNQFIAAQKAFAGAKDSGFIYSFEDCYKIFYNKYDLEKYDKYKDLLKYAYCSIEDTNAFYAHYDAENAFKALESDIKNCVPASGQFDNYLRALAKYDYLSENSKQLESRNKELYEEELARQKSMVESTRREAITRVAAPGLVLSTEMGAVIGTGNLEALINSTGIKLGGAIGSTSLKQIIAIYEEARQYVALAEEAIEVLAKSENYTVKYQEGKPQTLEYIDLSDPEIPFVVKQAVERAQSAYYSIEEDKFTPIVDGYKTEYTYNGKPIYQSATNSNLYYYGTYEEGYQYVKMTKVNGEVTFGVYDDNLSYGLGSVNGKLVCENSKEEFGKEVYFTISGGKMTYYEKVADGVYVEKAPIVYDGQLFKTLKDGTKIYKDGDVYYSVDETTGEYTRYTYTMSIRGCYEEVVKANEEKMEIIAEFDKNSPASDDTILEDVLSRIDVNERIAERVEIVEEEQEVSKYATDNIVAVTYGNADGSAYKTVILNYNNYDVNIEYMGVMYTIPAYYFVVHEN